MGYGFHSVRRGGEPLFLLFLSLPALQHLCAVGGLGSAVAEVLAEQCPCKMHRLGIQDRFGEVGDRAYLRKCMGIDTTDIVDAALNIKKVSTPLFDPSTIKRLKKELLP